MLDARSIFRKVSRSVCDFSPEQQKNIAAIVWLYRGQQDRFLKLVKSYLAQAMEDGAAAQPALSACEEALGTLADLIEPFAAIAREDDKLAEPWGEMTSTQATLAADIEAFSAEVLVQAGPWPAAGRDNAELHAARTALHPLAERCRDLTKLIDLAAKLAGRVIDIAVKELAARKSDAWANAEVNRARKTLDEARAAAVEALRRTRYIIKQADWLQERFPDARFRDVEGLVKQVDRATIAAHDWSLTPSRYVGVAPEAVDEEFDFEETLRAIHIDLSGLNEEALELADRIAKSFQELGV